MKRPVPITAVSLVALATAPALHAATFTWTGGGLNNNLSTAANWKNTAAPPNDGSADLLFSNITNVYLFPFVNTPYAIEGLTFTGSGNYTVGGNSALTIGGGGIVVADTSNQTISANITLSATQLWKVPTGELNVTGHTNLANDTLQFQAASGGSIIMGPIAGAGSVLIEDNSGNGNVFYQGLANYTGNTVISGALALNAGAAITASNISVTGGGSLLGQGGNIANANGSLTLGSAGTKTATASLNSSNVLVANLTIGNTGNATFNHYSGNATINNTLTLGGGLNTTGTYNFYNTNTLNAATAYIGYSSTGAFNHSFGNAAFSGNVYLGYNAHSNGTYTMSSGHFSAQQLDVGYSGNGTFSQNGGTAIVSAPGYGNVTLGTNAGAFGSYSLNNASLTGNNLLVGASGNGTFSQSNSSASFYTVYLGASVGSSGNYTLSGNSTLSMDVLEVAYFGNGTFTQNGGAVNVAAGALITSGYEAGTTAASYTLNNGTFSAQQLAVGVGLDASFTQNGGTVTLNTTQFPPALDLGRHDFFGNGTGTYNLNAGTLQASSVGLDDGGTANFNFNGGTLQSLASSTSWVGGGFTANIGHPGAIIDTQNFNDTFNAGLQPLPTLGPVLDGGLQKRGNGTLTLGATVSYAGPTTVSNGTLIFAAANNSVAGISGAGNLTINANASLISDGILVNALTLSGSAQIRTTTTTAGTTKVASLTLAGNTDAWTGALDLTNNRLIVEASNTTKSTTLATLQNQVLYGATHPAGISSSTLPANATIGIFDNGALPTPFATFAGQQVDNNSILIVPALFGDANLDGKVDLNDLNTVLNHLGTTNAGWTTGNFNGAATVDLNDLNDVLNALGTSFGTSSAVTTEPLVAAVPEPASLAIACVGLSLFLRRRRL